MDNDTTELQVKPTDWTDELAGQLEWHWENLFRPRLDGLSDDEYFWEPVSGCWSVRPRGEADPALAFGSGPFVAEYAWPEPSPPPVTTIAWRLGHIITGCLGARSASHFGAPPVDPRTYEYAGTAAEAIEQLDGVYASWIGGVRGLDLDGLARPCGPAEGPYAEYPLSSLVMHINREVIHHAAEIALLRDLYRWKGTDVQAL
jgi:DinB superfamily